MKKFVIFDLIRAILEIYCLESMIPSSVELVREHYFN